jgi:hypothetical protein
MIASNDYILTNEVINVCKQPFWEVSTLLQTMDVKQIFVWSEASQELSLWCLVVHMAFDIFKMATVVFVTMKVFLIRL